MSPKKLQGVLLGLSNTAGVLAGVFGTAATGYILQKGKTLKIKFFFSSDL
jgi:ACS family sodium-dependent inorganic phosphate cotransporter